MQGDARDYSMFSHANAAHARLPCLLCHRRESNAPQPKLPGHLPCAGCHKQEFANTGSPMCTICHTNVQTGAMKSFPPLKSFTVHFDHAQHIGAGRSSAACATCHRPERRGVALSIPARLGAHSTCFQCHAPGAQARDGRDISSCSTCHNLGRFARTPAWSRAYRVNFSHAEHGPRRRLNCSDCHSVRAGLPQARQVSAPVPAMHSASARAQSCMTCHNDKRAFGIADFRNCKRCHEGPTFRLSFLEPFFRQSASDLSSIRPLALSDGF
jgi:c(7)-type cytochrome triheme protein